MRRALGEAQKGLGSTSPNPAVGVVFVRNGKIIARGHHRRAGLAHAEIECLRNVANVRNGTLYVTLEPCSTAGRTPACTDYILSRAIGRVVIGTTDPNPRHRGRGIQLLRDAGVDVTVGVLEQECRDLNETFNKWIQIGEPFVIAKCAMSLDGRLTRADSRWLSSPQSRRHAQNLRAGVDAILIGAQTLRRDDPRLTVRLRRKRLQPWRVVLTRSAKLPRGARIFNDRHRDRTLVYKNKSLRFVLRDLGRREITSVLIEGGSDILSQALDQRLIDRIHIYLSPLFTGGNILAFSGNGARATNESLQLHAIKYKRIKNDVCVTGRVAVE